MKRLFPPFLLLIFFSFNSIDADTITVSGDVSGTWSADTVLVTGEALVPPGAVLEILPGVEVLFTVYCKLIVQENSTLMAVGTELEPIRFDAYYASNWWQGIRFTLANDTSRLEHCIIKRGWASGTVENMGGGLQLITSSPTIYNSIIDSCKADLYGGGIYGYHSNAAIDNCIISHNFGSYGAGAMFFIYNSAPSITNNEISSNSSNGWCGGIRCSNSNSTITNNTISWNTANDDAGGIYFHYSDGILSGNIISNNSSGDRGGGIFCYHSSLSILNNNIISNYSADDGGGINVEIGSSPIITGNVISNNTSNDMGGGICSFSTPALIGENLIIGNSSGNNGGGIYCSSPNNIISGNFISGNTAGMSGYGGGLYLSDSYQVVTDNMFAYNFAANGGGIYAVVDFNVNIKGNSVAYNSALGQCGGAYLIGTRGAFNKNTIRDNNSTTGGGLHIQSGSFTLTSLIVRGNSTFQITGVTQTVTYSNIEGDYPGTGNIDADPLFATVAQPFSEILWGSPCIDSGNPDPMFFDHDTTRSDMGACFYDQSKPVRMLATPYDAPNLIPAEGGSFNLKLTLSNHTASQQPTVIYCDITLPGGGTYSPVIGPINYTAAPNSNISRIRTQNVPAMAPMGVYHFNAYAVIGADTSKSSFMFGKLGVSDGDGTADWSNRGDPFEGPVSYTNLIANQPLQFSLVQAFPNPFNPVTTIQFSLPEACRVRLEVFDISGRSQGSPLQGWREAGDHEGTGVGRVPVPPGSGAVYGIREDGVDEVTTSLFPQSASRLCTANKA